MSQDIRIKKGLNIKLVGEADKKTTPLPVASVYAVKPDDFHKITPKLIVKVGSDVKAGEALFYSKSNEQILFPSPVSGEVVEIVRGAKRKVLAIKVLADKEQRYQDFGKKEISQLDGEEVKKHLLASGCWPFIKRRPYDVVADPTDDPKAIFISAYATAPLATDLNYALSGKEAELQVAVTALSKMTKGKVHICVGKGEKSPLGDLKNAEIHRVTGPHPAGNVSVQIAKIDPINKGEVVWVVTPQDLVIIGELLLTGKFNAKRTIALTGSRVDNPSYVEALIGAPIDALVEGQVTEKDSRIISGNVLTGTQVSKQDFFGYYDNQITSIPEGNDYEFFGWNKPIFNKISNSRALTFSWLTPNKKYDLTTNTNGEHRAFVLTGNYEKVFPLDIYPLQILKACIYKDLDEMEALGMYEVAPEDFALTEFICVSKQPHQEIIRQGLDLMIEEIG
ncbi:Na(+)-translocating NADH-quinone reductase subunit A [Flavobacteriaceae bacterium F08102]|nr:Na(+)-translocating NADH-quinone reductase subunit A [Flavobacteriaceae bacterium F08102]